MAVVLERDLVGRVLGFVVVVVLGRDDRGADPEGMLRNPRGGPPCGGDPAVLRPGATEERMRDPDAAEAEALGARLRLFLVGAQLTLGDSRQVVLAPPPRDA